MIITDSKYKTGFKLEEYKGTFSIAACQQGKDGKEYVRWCHPQIMLNGAKSVSEKSLPIQIKLGSSRQAAIEALKEIIGELEG